MSTFFTILIIVIAIIVNIKDNKKQKPTPTPQQRTAEEEFRRMIREAQQREAEQKEKEIEEYYDEEEDSESEEEIPTPSYEPMPTPQTAQPSHNDAEHIDYTLDREDMCPTALNEGLPEEGGSSLSEKQLHDEDSPIQSIEQPEQVLSADDMRRAVIYQTILERPKF